MGDEVMCNFESSKYHELMAKFVRSKDLGEAERNVVEVEGQMLLEEKINGSGRKSRNSNEEDLSNK